MPQIALAPNSPDILPQHQTFTWTVPDDGLLGDDIRKGDIIKFSSFNGIIEANKIYLVRVGHKKKCIAGRIRLKHNKLFIHNSNPKYVIYETQIDNTEIVGVREHKGFLRLVEL